MARKAGLGRGLDSLLGEVKRDVPTAPQSSAGDERGTDMPGGIVRLPIGDIRPHPEQPRRHFAEAALDELAQSISARGVIQPIVVRQLGRQYQIIAGERRWRAAQRARLHEIPAIIRDFSDSEALEIALIENIQREDLNPIEEAEAYHRLIEQFGHTQAELGRLVDKSRSHVANLMRLLDLPKPVRQYVMEGTISMGHARALLSLDDPESAAQQVIRDGLNVRQTEALARKPAKSKEKSFAPDAKGNDADVAALERQLSELLGLTVSIEQKEDGKGRLILGYRTLDQLDMLCQRLTGEEF